MNPHYLEFKVKDYMVEHGEVDRLKSDYQTMRCLTISSFTIQVDNSKSNSHNHNIDYPTFHCFAVNEAEAIGLMMLSDFKHKHLKINKIIVV